MSEDFVKAPSVLLYGGGIDSTAVAFFLKYEAKKEFDLMVCDYGQIAYSEEWDAALKLADRLDVTLCNRKTILPMRKGTHISPLVDKSISKNESPEIWGRNFVLLYTAFMEYDEVWMGLDKPESGVPMFDTRKDYIDKVEKFFEFALQRRISIYAPFLELDKIKMCRDMLNLDPKFFDYTMTCWFPEFGKECGKCKHCKIKIELMKKLVIFTPQEIKEENESVLEDNVEENQQQ